MGAHPPRGVAGRHRRSSRSRSRWPSTRPGPRGDGGRVARAAADRARFVVVDAGRDAPRARRAGSAPSRRRARAGRRRRAARVALATTADGLVEGPTTDLALIETALDRSRPGGGDATAWPRVAGATRALHHRRRDRPAARPGGRRALGVRAGAERRHHRVRRAPVARHPATPARPTSRSPTSRPRRRRCASRSRAAPTEVLESRASTSAAGEASGRCCRFRAAAIRRCGPSRRAARTRWRSTTRRSRGWRGRGRSP